MEMAGEDAITTAAGEATDMEATAGEVTAGEATADESTAANVQSVATATDTTPARTPKAQCWEIEANSHLRPEGYVPQNK